MVLSFTTGLAFQLRTVYSDSLTGNGGALTQRIGNFDVELKTIPAKPIAGDKMYSSELVTLTEMMQ